ncbi:flagellar assembly peptidoglycan hydrolase FlgJ [Pseudomarimonas arenosa]|uniref:Peptidoglycan hydrolase FlgJ n=1 Tax=Pseudomarimonas arenosa TaxID=2774145 RepID=A0AAW3ZII7_9GAMM|nr:flagellar assembly peptidoglycan hydrolase FlgJ [Pseudomarimonas arenosa]MBD8524755.1 flagellar assembly peptidoglycan hydrolase FlgJ [Pseudomarimonas arenosa]
MQAIKNATGLPLDRVEQGGQQRSPEQAARMLESQFAKMMIGMMRKTALGDSMFPGAAAQFADIYDREIANVLTQGKGLGMQAMIRRQLEGQAGVDAGGDARFFPLDSARGAAAYRAIRPFNPPIPISALETSAPHPKAAPAPEPGKPSPLSQHTPNIDQSEATAYAASVPDTPEAFVAELWPHAQRAAAELGVSPKALLAQAALETGWGKHMPKRTDGSSGNNLFGIKGHGWQGEVLAANTHEFVNGQRVEQRDQFRAYRSAAESFNDYVAMLKNSPRYANALGQDNPHAFASALQQAGYATDPRYAAKINAIAHGPTLQRALDALHTGSTRSA